MDNWKITWIDGPRLREITVVSSPYDLVNTAINNGVNVFAIVKMEKVAQ